MATFNAAERPSAFPTAAGAVEQWMERLGLQGKAVLTTVETAALLRICERSVREGIKKGWIPHVRLGRRVVVPVPRLVAMLAPSDDEHPSE